MDLACSVCGDEVYEGEDKPACFACKNPLDAQAYICVELGEESAHFCSEECAEKVRHKAQLVPLD